jgi:hypothetical protein
MSTLQQINQKAQRLLRTELGPVDYVRYQQQFTQGSGDYTAERQAAPASDITAISERVATMKAAGLLPIPPSAKVMEIQK